MAIDHHRNRHHGHFSRRLRQDLSPEHFLVWFSLWATFFNNAAISSFAIFTYAVTNKGSGDAKPSLSGSLSAGPFWWSELNFLVFDDFFAILWSWRPGLLSRPKTHSKGVTVVGTPPPDNTWRAPLSGATPSGLPQEDTWRAPYPDFPRGHVARAPIRTPLGEAHDTLKYHTRAMLYPT